METWVLVYGSTIVQMALLVRVLTLKAVRQYRWFLLFLILSIARAVYMQRIPTRTVEYAKAWTYSQPFISLAYVMSAYEVYSRTMAAYPVLGSAGRWILGIGGSVALAINLVLMSRETGLSGYVELLQAMFIVRRVASGTVVAFMMLLAFALWRVYIPASRNTVLHRRLLTFYCCVMAIQQFSVNLIGKEAMAIASKLFMGAEIVIFSAWAVLLKPEGEAPPPRATSEQADAAERECSQIMELVRSIRPGE